MDFFYFHCHSHARKRKRKRERPSHVLFASEVFQAWYCFSIHSLWSTPAFNRVQIDPLPVRLIKLFCRENINHSHRIKSFSLSNWLRGLVSFPNTSASFNQRISCMQPKIRPFILLSGKLMKYGFISWLRFFLSQTDCLWASLSHWSAQH